MCAVEPDIEVGEGEQDDGEHRREEHQRESAWAVQRNRDHVAESLQYGAAHDSVLSVAA